MQTINSNVNFTGVYRIPKTPKNIKEINEKVIPMYSFLKHEPVAGFPGENPFVLGFEVLKDVVAKAIDLYQKERLEYLKFIQSKKVVPVETTQELLTKMLMEG